MLGFGNLGELICDRRVGDELGVKEVQLAAQPKLLYTGPAPLPFCLPENQRHQDQNLSKSEF